MEQLLTAADVARVLSMDRKTVYRLVGEGRLPAPYRLGRILRWSQESIQKYLDDSKAKDRGND